MTDRSGQDLGHYRLVRLLGAGGFADVYLGEHRILTTPAAIKVLNTHLATPEQVDQFSQEAYLIARLIHPHIVRLLDFGVDGDVPFLVMDYAPHGTLRHQYPPGIMLPLWQLLPYVQQVADALQYAHDHQLIHRDVKPENLLLGRQGEIWLSDFGIAVVAHNTESLPTQDTAHTLGTVAYMAPEQLRGDPRPASDQYALAIVVYEWLAGKRPFVGTPLELVYQQQYVSPPPLRNMSSAISQGVDAVVMQALAKDPKNRFASVQSFATALKQASQEAVLPAMESLSSLAALPPDFGSPQRAVDLLPTTILPEPPPSEPPFLAAPSPRDPAQEEAPAVPSSARARPLGELTTLPEDDQADQSPPRSARAAARPSPRRTRGLFLAATLLAVLLGAALLVLFSGLLSSTAGSGKTSASNSVQTPGSPASTSQTSDPAPRPSTGATGSVLPTPVGTSPTGSPYPTGTTAPGSTPTATSSPTPSPLSPQLMVNPLALNFTLSVVNCSLQNQPQTLTVKNSGDSGMNWQATIQNPAYLTLSQSAGHLDAGQSDQINVSFVCQNIVVHATDVITFTSNGGGTVVVTVTITLS